MGTDKIMPISKAFECIKYIKVPKILNWEKSKQLKTRFYWTFWYYRYINALKTDQISWRKIADSPARSGSLISIHSEPHWFRLKENKSDKKTDYIARIQSLVQITKNQLIKIMREYAL